LIFFQDEQTAAKKIVVSVKGGQNVSVQMIRDLRGVVEREKAAIGLFVTLADPTPPMRAEAIKAGFYVSPQGKQVPRMQIVTIAGLLDESESPRYTDISAGEQTFKRIRPDHEKSEQTELFEDERVLSCHERSYFRVIPAV
jgi:site-specific DNA-methyltransferase (adenine-specific)